MPELHDDELHPSYIGIPTYLGTPFAKDEKELKKLNADVSIIGAPVDMGVVARPGARFGPRAIRQADYWPTKQWKKKLPKHLMQIQFL